MHAAVIPTEITDPVNARILSVSEDMPAGFAERPYAAIAAAAEVTEEVVIERLAAMLRAGTIGRIRQSLNAINLAAGALVAWQVPWNKLDSAFEYMARNDPFSGQVVIRSADGDVPGASYRLWTTVKIPRGFSMEKHCELLAERTGADAFRVMPAKRLFVAGTRHTRRRRMPPGSKTDEPGQAIEPVAAELSYSDWQVLGPMRREFAPDEIVSEPWRGRAEEAGLPYDEFVAVAGSLDERGVIGPFLTSPDQMRSPSGGEPFTRYDALFHWRVPEGREIQAGAEIARHHVLTRAHWREGGPEFGDVNLMAVAHGLDKDVVQEHKRAIDDHLFSLDIHVLHTSVFWGGRSEIKPSEVSPVAYERWCAWTGVNPATMRPDSD